MTEEKLADIIIKNDRDIGQIDFSKLRPKIITSCVDNCPFGIRHLLHLINFVIGIAFLLFIMLPIMLLINIISLPWRFIFCQCCIHVREKEVKRIYHPAKPNCCCHRHSRNFYARWRLHLMTTQPKYRWCCWHIQDRIVLFYQVMEFALNLGNNTFVDLLNSLANTYGEYFPFNTGIVTCNSEEIVELVTSPNIEKQRSVFGIPPSTENHGYTKCLLPIQDTGSKEQVAGRNIFHGFFKEFYNDYVNSNVGKTKNWNDIFDSIKKRCSFLIPARSEGVPEKNDVLRYTARVLFYLITNERLTDPEEQSIVDYVSKYGGTALFSNFLHFLFGGNFFQRKLVQYRTPFREALLRNNTPRCLQAILKSAKDNKFDEWEAISNIIRAFIVNTGTTTNLILEILKHLHANPEKWMKVWEENPINIIREASRLSSPLPVTSFLLTKDREFTVGNKKVIVPAGTPIIVPICVYNRDPKIFGGPEQSAEYASEFDPHRDNLGKVFTWAGSEELIDHANKKYHPSRYCVGRDLAISVTYMVVELLKPEWPIIKKLGEKESKKLHSKLDEQTCLMMKIFGEAALKWQEEQQNILFYMYSHHKKKEKLKKLACDFGIDLPCDGTDEDWPSMSLSQILITNLLKNELFNVVDELAYFDNVQQGQSWLKESLGKVLPRPNVMWKELTSNHAMKQLAFSSICSHRTRTVNDEDKLYDPNLPSNCAYVNDFTWLYPFKVRKGLERYGAKAYFDNKCNIIGIYVSYNNKYVKALNYNNSDDNNDKNGDEKQDVEEKDSLLSSSSAFSSSLEWEHAKWVWKVSIATGITIVDHLVWTHFVESNSFVIVTRETLSADHPLRVFLKPFTFRIIAINYKASTNLVAERGPVHRTWGLPYDEVIKVLKFAAKTYQYTPSINRFDPKMKQLLSENEYPLVHDVECYWNIISILVNSYFDIFWPKNDLDNKFNKDMELREFYDAICVRLGIVHPYTREKLIEILIQLIVSVTGFHEHVGVVIDYLMQVDFMGTKIYKNATSADIQSYAQVLGVAILTGLRQPMLLEIDYTKFYQEWANNNHEYNSKHAPVIQLFQNFVSSCRKMADDIDRKNKTRVQENNSFNPRNLETSVSI